MSERNRGLLAKLVCAASFVLAGCSGPSVVRKEIPALPFSNTALPVELRISQRQIYVKHDPSTAGSQAGNQAGMQAAMNPQITHGSFGGGAAAGLIGALIGAAIDAGVNAHRSSVAEELTKPLQANTDSIDFNAMIEASLGSLDRQEFASEYSVVRLDTPLAEDEKAGRLNTGKPILVLVPSYYVSYDQTEFVYQLAAAVVDRDRSEKGTITTTQRYGQLFLYSLPLAEFHGVQRWSELSADQWKNAMKSATDEIVQMLNYDVAARPSDSSQIVKEDGPLKWHLDKENGDRTWLRTPFALRSIPRVAAKIETK